jgi:hypothetical protein
MIQFTNLAVIDNPLHLLGILSNEISKNKT